MYHYLYSYLLLLVAVIFSVYAQIKVNTTFTKFSSVNNSLGITGADAARRILDSKGLYNVQIELINYHLADHYDPQTNVLRLSPQVYNGTSISAVGVAAHECGHAIQTSEKYAPLVFRSRLVGITSICSKISFGLIFLGIILDALGSIGFIFQLAGIIAFAVVTFFQLVTLPTEFDASRRALEIMGNQGILKRDELGGAKSVLDAAAMTYVAALAVSLIQLLRLIMTIRRHD